MDMFKLGELGVGKEGGRIMTTLSKEEILKDVQFRWAELCASNGCLGVGGRTAWLQQQDG
jgi:hypothetical protein